MTCFSLQYSIYIAIGNISFYGTFLSTFLLGAGFCIFGIVQLYCFLQSGFLANVFKAFYTGSLGRYRCRRRLLVIAQFLDGLGNPVLNWFDAERAEVRELIRLEEGGDSWIREQIRDLTEPRPFDFNAYLWQQMESDASLCWASKIERFLGLD